MFSILGGFIGIAVGYHIAKGKDKADPSGATFLYDEPSRKLGRIMLGTAVVMTFLWLVIRIAA